MAPPASFAKLCSSAKIALPTSAQRVQFLVDAGIPADSVNSTAKELWNVTGNCLIDCLISA